ncbi:MAG: sodium-dependent transporter [Lachnospiraceae bacterium]|uniref:Transporter n=1 Tax=Candidatus Weimeria bifida TaxID=2599074 RepID=A0A6N7IZ68_9FIRM|nr:sodium-dependent transporter [Candidatus Weimeria bifida]RRF97015.1 MAG: sodium-dependent transporter [Lachnospiraceae bacterium]
MSEQQPNREKFASRLGFILVSAGCAIGIGNVWKFPYLCGQYGGAAFILIYLVFLVIMGIPVMIFEFAVGRASQHSAALAFDTLEPEGTHWHIMKIFCMVGNYLLMMYYTTVCGWMFDYFVRQCSGEFVGATPKQVQTGFNEMLGNTGELALCTIVVCLIGFLICFFGVQNGVERITKWMMAALFILMIILTIHSVFLEGAGAGIRFYLVPDFKKMAEIGIGNVVYQAMGQSFFTLSIGMGSMLIFGSYLDKERSLTGEATTVTSLDTAVALMAGFIIIPACFAFGIQPDAGPSLIFITIPNLFAKMPGGQFWGALFFVFLSFAALSTVIAVFENIIAFDMDLFKWSRKKSVLICAPILIALSLPCVLGFNVWSGFQPLGKGSTILDLEDFIVSNNVLPLGSFVFVLFCTRKNGWGWDNFLKEADTGKGVKFPRSIRWYVTWVLPVIILVIFFKGYYDKFAPMGRGPLVGWMIFAVALVGFLLYCASSKPRKSK